MKIALICDWYLPRIGGLELHVRDLARELNARGHEAHVITSTPAEDAAQFRKFAHKGGDADDFPVHRLDVPLMPGLNTIRSRGAVAELEAIVRANGYDLLHCHTLLSPLAHAGAFVAKKLGLPSVMTEHSVLRHAGMYALRLAQGATNWAKWPHVLTAVSSFVADDVRRASGRDECLVLPNGIRADEWDGAHRRHEELRVVGVMRMTKRKRPVEIVRAARVVLDRLPPGARRPIFTLVGDGPERARAEREAARLGLQADVEFTGWQERPFVRDLLGRSAIFVLPTRKEALSIASLQALSSGLPVVAMGHGGVGDILTHGRDGFLAGDEAEFADCILRLVTDDALRARMRENARETVARFCWSRVIDQHLECYQLAASRAGVTLPEAAALRRTA